MSIYSKKHVLNWIHTVAAICESDLIKLDARSISHNAVELAARLLQQNFIVLLIAYMKTGFKS